MRSLLQPPLPCFMSCVPYFAADFTQANIQFARTSPSVHSGRSVTLEAKDDVPHWDLPYLVNNRKHVRNLQRVKDSFDAFGAEIRKGDSYNCERLTHPGWVK